MAAIISRRLFTADDYQRMGQTGILTEDDRVELIDGEIVAMTQIGPRHGASVDRATRALVTCAGDRAIVRVRGSVRLNLFNEPEPDLVLLRPRDDFYASAHPGPADIFLIVEIADSSFEYDRDVKAHLYARLGVPEYWLADLNGRVLLCHTAPSDGRYREVRSVPRGDLLAPQLLTGCRIAVEDLIAD